MSTRIFGAEMGTALRNLLRPVLRLLTYSPFALVRERRMLRKALSSWEGRHVFIFSYLNTGGAEQVHADIMDTVADQRPLIVITGFSKDRAFADRFARSGVLLEVPRLIHHPFTAKATRRALVERINAAERPVFLGANTDHFFGLLPALKPATRALFLQHAFLYQPNGNVKHKQWVRSFGRVERYLFVSGQAKREFERFLLAQHVPASQFGKLVMIPNAVHAFGTVQDHARIGLLFVGRDSAEKRLDLFLDVVDHLERRAPGRFHATVVGTRARSGHPQVTFTGTISNADELSATYARHDLLLLTSEREGFPLVVMEAMAHGLAIIAAPVGDIPGRLDPSFSVITSGTDAESVLHGMTDAILALDQDRARLRAMRDAALIRAHAEFDIATFRERYRALLMAPEA